MFSQFCPQRSAGHANTYQQHVKNNKSQTEGKQTDNCIMHAYNTQTDYNKDK